MKKVKLVICDVDNTLVQKHDILSRRAHRILEKLRDDDVLFGIASGRSLEEMKRILYRWDVDHLDVLIALNGSVLWDEIVGRKTTYFQLKKQWIKEILETMEHFSANPLIYRNDQILCGHIDEIVRLSADTAGMEAIEIGTIEELYQEENAKIMFRVKEDEMPEIENYLMAHPSPFYHAFKTQSTLIEFSDKRISKAYALKQFCDIHKISMDTVMAFGDTTNDNEMLKESGLGICLCNGSEDTKKIADKITRLPCEQDGWADFMECYHIQNGGWMI